MLSSLGLRTLQGFFFSPQYSPNIPWRTVYSNMDPNQWFSPPTQLMKSLFFAFFLLGYEYD